ncbi:MAG: Uma2 family endonuclease [Burkholderiales bacterium]|nr:Uma2 family endonuclease [Anaerolineae bacterium]
MAIAKLYTVEEFLDYVEKHEDGDSWFELIDGEIIEVSPGRTNNSEFGHNIVVPVHNFCRTHKIKCHTSGETGTYQIGSHVVAPDFAFKHMPMSHDYPDPMPPLWAVEFISPTDKPKAIRNKRKVYIDAEILYWEAFYPSRSVDVYAPGKPMQTFGIDDTLDGGDVLPGFTLSVRDIFGESL